jgi:hypothetical protein
VPLVDPQGKLCISAERRTFAYPAGTALAVSKVLEPKIKSFLECCYTQYVHFMGVENTAELPCDPLLVGLTHRFERQMAGKCVEERPYHLGYPRYVSTKAAFHLLGTVAPT